MLNCVYCSVLFGIKSVNNINDYIFVKEFEVYRILNKFMSFHLFLDTVEAKR